MAQAGRRWQRTLFPWMKDNGFAQTDGDTCVFRKVRKDEEKRLKGLERDAQREARDIVGAAAHDDAGRGGERFAHRARRREPAAS